MAEEYKVRIGGQFIADLPVASEFEKIKPEAHIEVVFDHEPTDDDIQILRAYLDKAVDQATSSLLEGYANFVEYMKSL